MSDSDARKALADMVGGLKSVFNRYNRSARKKAWKSLQTGQGKQEIEKLLDSPTKPIVGVYKWLSFKEWMNHQD